MNSYGADEEAKYKVQHMTHIKEALESKGNLDILDWVLLGKHFSKNAEEEVAF